MTYISRDEEKQAQERRRFIECLTSARINVASAHKSLLTADLWAADRAQADKVITLYNGAKNLHDQIVALLQEVQGE